MNKKIKIFNISVLVFVLGVGFFGFKYYNRPPLDTATLETEEQFSSEELGAIFSGNENAAITRYVDKIIEVEGVIKEITYLNKHYSVLLHGQNNSGYIICDMKPSNEAEVEKLKPGQKVNIKGVCKGYLKDVILLNCILVNSESNE